MEALYAIKDLERISGIKAHTLRIWELRYGILKPKRTDTNIRYYTGHDLKRILNISLLNNNGYKISKIAKLSDEEIINKSKSILNSQTKEIDQIHQLTLSMMELNEFDFEKIISNCIAHFGFENTIENIVFPFMKQIGNMWQVGAINAVQEHFVSHLVRQKLIAAIDRIQFNLEPNHKTYLFYLIDNELHELGLLYCHYLTKAKGQRCVYLGQSVPMTDLISVTNTIHPDILITSFTNIPEYISIQEYLNNLSKNYPTTTILVSGWVFFDENNPILLPKNVILFKTHKEFKNMLHSYNFVGDVK